MIAVVVAVGALVGAGAPARVALTGRPMRPCVVAASGDATTIVQGLDDGSVTAVDARTLRVRWTKKVGRQGLHASPAVAPTAAGDVVIAGAFAGDVVGLALADGHERWRTALPRMQNGERSGTTGAPFVVGDGTVVIGVLGGVLTLDVDDGHVVRHVQTLAGTLAPTVVRTRDRSTLVFIDEPSASVVGVDVSTWTTRFRLRGPIIDRERNVGATFQAERIPVRGGLAFVPTNVAETWAIDVDAGVKRVGYEAPGGGGAIDAPVLDEDSVYVVSSTSSSGRRVDRSTVTAFDRETGAARWSVPVPSLVAGPVIVGGFVVAGAEDGRVRFFSATDGTVTTTTVGGPVWWGGCVDDQGRVWIGDDKKHLNAVPLPAAPTSSTDMPAKGPAP